MSNRNSSNMSGEELGKKLLRSVGEMKAGEVARSNYVAPNDIATARAKTGLSQSAFARALDISPRTLQEWEQGRRTPSGAARTLVRIAMLHPEVIRELAS